MGHFRGLKVNNSFNRYEKCWPAIQQDCHGAVIVIDNKNMKYENDLDFWINKFCKTVNLPLNAIMCLSYRKTDEKNDKPRQCKNIFIILS